MTLRDDLARMEAEQRQMRGPAGTIVADMAARRDIPALAEMVKLLVDFIDDIADDAGLRRSSVDIENELWALAKRKAGAR